MNCRTIEAIALSSRKSSPSASRQAVSELPTCRRLLFPYKGNRRRLSESREMHLTDHAISRHAIIPFLCRGLFVRLTVFWINQKI